MTPNDPQIRVLQEHLMTVSIEWPGAPIPAETDWFAHNTGSALICIGCLGVLLNVLCLSYFLRLKTETEQSVYTRIAFINLAVVDLLLSLSAACLRGPGYLFPETIWGEQVVKNNGRSAWCEAGSLISWYVSDLNLLGVIPLSVLVLFPYVPCLSLSKLKLGIVIACCWLAPALEIVFIVASVTAHEITTAYDNNHRRCVFGGEYEKYLDRENAATFFACPLAVHLVSWSLIIFYVCRRGNGYGDKQWWKFLKTGVIVIVTFTITWLPYFVVYVWQQIRPSGWFTFIYCFLYSSVVLNPMIYGTRSMRFNGKTVMEVVCEECGGCAKSGGTDSVQGSSVEERGIRNEAYSSYGDLDDGEDMKTMA